MKKLISISGKIVFPLREGAKAVIAYNGDFIYTSFVIKILMMSECVAHFETVDAIYRVSLNPEHNIAHFTELFMRCA